MQTDTRSSNKYFCNDSLAQYTKEYAKALETSLNLVDQKELQKAHEMLRTTRALFGRVFVAGNGGSSAIADHLCCDFSKGVQTNTQEGFESISLTAHQATFTAIANDLGYDQTFKFQLKLYNITIYDTLILISSSGNSKNIMEALNYAKERGVMTIGLSGFDGGKLYELAECKLHVPIHNYGVVEDSHQALMHILAQFEFLTHG